MSKDLNQDLHPLVLVHTPGFAPPEKGHPGVVQLGLASVKARP